MIDHREEPVDVRLSVEGCRLVGRDAYGDGSVGVIKSSLGDYKTPEHAAAMGLLMGRPDFLLLVSLGKIDENTLDRMAEAILTRKQRA